MKSIAGFGFLLLSLGIALGAFGAHALKDYFSGREEEIWKTAVFYQIVQALGLLSLSSLVAQNFVNAGLARLCSKFLIAGTIIFSGSLYFLVATRAKWLGAVTPFGGSLLILSWLVLAVGTFRSKN